MHRVYKSGFYCRLSHLDFFVVIHLSPIIICRLFNTTTTFQLQKLFYSTVNYPVQTQHYTGGSSNTMASPNLNNNCETWRAIFGRLSASDYTSPWRIRHTYGVRRLSSEMAGVILYPYNFFRCSDYGLSECSWDF